MTRQAGYRIAVSFLAAVAVAVLIGLSPAQAGKPAVYSADGELAVKGADVVAYFTEGRAVYGKAEFSHRWMGRLWRFKSAANRDRFKANPMKYAPQYGGYCAYAVGNGYTAKIEPEAWSIHKGKLYLNYSRSVRALWALRKSRYIRQGDRNWPGVLDK